MFRFSSSDRPIFFEKLKKKRKKIQDSPAKEANTLKCPCDHSIDVKCTRDQKIHSYFSLGLKTTNTKRPMKRPGSDHEATNVLCEKRTTTSKGCFSASEVPWRMNIFPGEMRLCCIASSFCIMHDLHIRHFVLFM